MHPNRCLTIGMNRILIFLFLALSAGCVNGSGDAEATPESIQSTPTIASIVLPNYRTAPSPVCLAGNYAVIRTSTTQGDLLAWSPASHQIAFVGSNANSNWNIGDLWVAAVQSTDPSIKLAENVVGNLSWSPGGKYLAFVSLRTGDGVYTLETASPDGKESVDFFPGATAKTDTWASPKIVRKWSDDSHLQALTSCGEMCAQPVDIDVEQNKQEALVDPEKILADYWQVHRNQPDPPPAILEDAREVNWSPDGTRAAYFDAQGNAWVLSPESQTQFLLPLPTWDSPYETKWSFDGDYLAVRAGYSLLIYGWICP